MVNVCDPFSSRASSDRCPTGTAADLGRRGRRMGAECLPTVRMPRITPRPSSELCCAVQAMTARAREVGAVLLLALVPVGCALRVGNVEHYIGPVLFRFRPPDAAVAAVSQVVRVGLAAEGGHQWGIAA